MKRNACANPGAARAFTGYDYLLKSVVPGADDIGCPLDHMVEQAANIVHEDLRPIYKGGGASGALPLLGFSPMTIGPLRRGGALTVSGNKTEAYTRLRPVVEEAFFKVHKDAPKHVAHFNDYLGGIPFLELDANLSLSTVPGPEKHCTYDPSLVVGLLLKSYRVAVHSIFGVKLPKNWNPYYSNKHKHAWAWQSQRMPSIVANFTRCNTISPMMWVMASFAFLGRGGPLKNAADHTIHMHPGSQNPGQSFKEAVSKPSLFWKVIGGLNAATKSRFYSFSRDPARYGSFLYPKTIDYDTNLKELDPEDYVNKVGFLLENYRKRCFTPRQTVTVPFETCPYSDALDLRALSALMKQIEGPVLSPSLTPEQRSRMRGDFHTQTDGDKLLLHSYLLEQGPQALRNPVANKNGWVSHIGPIERKMFVDDELWPWDPIYVDSINKEVVLHGLPG